MKTIKVSFDYKGKHYNVTAKISNNYEMTIHRCNADLDFYDNDGDYWTIYDYSTGVELQMSPDLREIEHVILWDKDNVDAPIVAVRSEFENYESEIC